MSTARLKFSHHRLNRWSMLANHYIDSPNLRQFASPLVMRLFNSAKTPCCSSSLISNSENSLACTLLAWKFNKKPARPLCATLIGASITTGKLDWRNLHTPTDFFLLSVSSFRAGGMNSGGGGCEPLVPYLVLNIMDRLNTAFRRAVRRQFSSMREVHGVFLGSVGRCA